VGKYEPSIDILGKDEMGHKVDYLAQALFTLHEGLLRPGAFGDIADEAADTHLSPGDLHGEFQYFIGFVSHFLFADHYPGGLKRLAVRPAPIGCSLRGHEGKIRRAKDLLFFLAEKAEKDFVRKDIVQLLILEKDD